MGRNKLSETKFIIRLTDEQGREALFSGCNDDPDMWHEYYNEFIHAIFNNIKVAIGNEYIYTVDKIKYSGLYFQLMSPDLTEEYSEKIELDKLAYALEQSDDVELIATKMTGRQFKLNIQGKELKVTEWLNGIQFIM